MYPESESRLMFQSQNQSTYKQDHLLNILKETKSHFPNFTLFLGAGASRNSEVKTANEMIDAWREAFYKQSGSTEKMEEFFKKYLWYKRPEEYSILFEQIYDHPHQRREYIEECLSGSSPSWGYIYLVNLLKQNVFNTVFTTNFDDLLNEACCSFSNDVRPIVCAHDSSINSIRITSKRQKIIKLHGDFLFDNIKNTVSELETLENNMREKFRQYAIEYGMIVIGCAGNDRSIMDILTALLRKDCNFPHGIYWCIQKDSTISEKVKMLLKFPKFKLVEIESFDKFFAELHESLGYSLQKEMSDPYGALAEKLNTLMDKAKIEDSDKSSHNIISRDITKIGLEIEKVVKALNSVVDSQGQGILKVDPIKTNDIKLNVGDGNFVSLAIPFGLLARVSKDRDLKVKYTFKQLAFDPSISDFQNAFSVLCELKEKTKLEELMDLFRRAENTLLIRPATSFNIAVELTKIKEFEKADEVLDMGHRAFLKTSQKDADFLVLYNINKLQLIKHKNIPYSGEQIEQLEEITKHTNPIYRMGAQILLDHVPEAEKELLMAEKQGWLKVEKDKSWPIFDFIRTKLANERLRSVFNDGNILDEAKRIIIETK